MINTTSKPSEKFKAPLASLRWLKYLGIVLLPVCAYLLVIFYNHFGDDIFPKSLTIGQHIKLAIFVIGSELSELIIPLFFFSGALLYRTVRLKGMNPLRSLLRDLLIIIPLGVMLWVYGAFVEESVNRKFYAMILDIKLLKSGEKLAANSNTYEYMEGANLNGLHDKIDTLTHQIKVHEAEFKALIQPGSPHENFVEHMRNERHKLKEEVDLIHLTPIYVLLFLIFGMIIGYLIKLHIVASNAIFLAIGYAWIRIMSFMEIAFESAHFDKSSVLMSKIGILAVLNITLWLVAIFVYNRLNENEESKMRS